MVDIQVHRPPLIWDIATSLPVATMLVGADDSVIFANPTWVEMTGIDETDALGDGWKRALSPRDARMASRLVHGAVHDAAPATARFRIETSSGPQTTVWHFAVHRTAIDDCRAIVVVHPSSRPIPQRTPQPEGLTTIDEFFDAADNALRGAASRQRIAMVMSVRVDGIDEIRRMYGNVAADGVTSVMLDRLRASLRPGDVAARPAPNELVVLCADVPSLTDAARVAARLNTALRSPVRLGPSEYHVRPNVGVATGTSATTGRTELYARSTEAMKVAAAAGGGVVVRGATPDVAGQDVADIADTVTADADRLRDLEQKLEEKTLLLGQLDHVLKSSFTVVMGWADMLSDRWSDLTPDRRRQGVAGDPRPVPPHRRHRRSAARRRQART